MIYQSWLNTSAELAVRLQKFFTQICILSYILHLVLWLVFVHAFFSDQNPNKFIVTAGDYDMDVYEQSEQNFEIKRIVIYPGYDDSTTNNDLALLELNSPLQFNGEISPICLPIAGFDPISETRCYATGWGDSQPYEGRNAFERSAATRARPLQQVEVDIIKRETCRIKYPGLISEQMICAGFDIGGRDPCQVSFTQANETAKMPNV